MTGYQTGDNNQLDNDGIYSYEYDDEGNRTSRTNDTTSPFTMTDAVIERYVYDDITGVASLAGGNVNPMRNRWLATAAWPTSRCSSAHHPPQRWRRCQSDKAVGDSNMKRDFVSRDSI